MKKIILSLAVALVATSAYAFCTQYTIQDASGNTLYCQKCCGADGNCQVYCF